jgi:hypothetical protein
LNYGSFNININTKLYIVPPLTLRNDPGVVFTLFPHLSKLIKGAPVAGKVEGSFKAISSTIVKDKFLVFYVYVI